MKLPPARHCWNVSPKRAVALQRSLAGLVRERRLRRPPRLVAGGDCAFTRDGRRIVAVWVVWDLRDACVIETATAACPLTFPYVPGLLSFREAPALLAAARKLRSDPDVLMLDGHGLAHPRRFGIACHVGLFLDRPTFGCAKSRLCGTHPLPADRVGARAALRHEGIPIGAVLRTRIGVKPVYVSIGHRITLDDAVRVTLACCTGYRLPEPTRRADQEAARLKGNT